MNKEQTDVAERLRSEMKRQGDWTPRDLQAALPPGTRGASHTSIYRYLDGQRPSDSFLLAAANVFGVRFEWLRYGEPPRSDEDRRIEPPAQGLRTVVTAHLARRAEEMRLQFADVVPPAANVALAILRLARTNREMEDSARMVADEVAELVFGPIRSLEALRSTKDRSSSYLHHVSAYASAICGALLVLVPEPRSPDVPLEDIVQEWRRNARGHAE